MGWARALSFRLGCVVVCTARARVCERNQEVGILRFFRLRVGSSGGSVDGSALHLGVQGKGSSSVCTAGAWARAWVCKRSGKQEVGHAALTELCAPGFWLSGDGAPFRISAIGLDTAPPGR